MLGAAKEEMTVTTRAENFDIAYICAISAVAALGGLLFGYDWVVIGGAKPFYEKFFHLTGPSQQGWAMSCALIGCLVGALVSGWLSDRFGRKRLLIAAGLVFAASSIGTGLAPSFAAFVPWRILGGFAIGMASSLSPMYIAEVAPAQYRGKLVSLNQLTIVIGILLAQVVNWLIAKPVPANATSLQILQSWNGQVGWRWMFGVTAIPSMLFFVAMFVVPESPRWLAKNGAHERAKHVLSRIGGESYGMQALREIEATVTQDTKQMDLRMLLDRRMLRVLLLGIGLAVLQQWCGINVIFNYAEEVFSAAGYNVSVGGSLRTAGLDAHWLGGPCDHLYLPGSSLLHAQSRDPHAGACGGCHRMLCDVTCSSDLGRHLRNLPEPYPRRCHIDRGHGALGGKFYPYLYFPNLQPLAGRR